MEFTPPKCIFDACKKLLKQNNLTYPDVNEAYFNAIINRYSYVTCKEQILPVSGVLPALRAIIQEFSLEWDSVVIFNPVYHAFYDIIKSLNRVALECKLVISKSDNRYDIDFDLLEKVFQEQPKILILCSPHNPSGRMWTRKELEKILNLCNLHGVILISDEIHCDLILNGNSFTSIGHLNASKDNVFILTSITKTFNVSGVRGGNVFTFCKQDLERLNKRLMQNGTNKLNSFYITSIVPAYTNGFEWLAKTRNIIYKKVMFTFNT